MTLYIVGVAITTYEKYEVDAESAQEAMQAYYDGDITWEPIPGVDVTDAEVVDVTEAPATIMEAHGG